MALTKKQLAMRLTGIGASEIPSVAGVSRWGSPAEIWAKKLGTEVGETTLAMDLGNLIEEPIARLYAKETGVVLTQCGTIRSPSEEIVIATPDRVVWEKRPAKGAPLQAAKKLLQVKHSTWRLRADWGDPGTDQIPPEYLVQVTWEMGAASVYQCDVAVLFDKDEFLIYTVDFNPDLFNDLVRIGRDFWTRYVVPKVPPPADATERYADAIAAYYREEKTKNLSVATEELTGLMFRLRALEAIVKEADTRAEVIRNELRRFIGPDTGVVSRAGTVTWKKTKDGTKTDWEAVARELHQEVGPESQVLLSDVIAKHTKTVPGHRRLHKSWSKELDPVAAELAIEILPGTDVVNPIELLLPEEEKKKLEARSAPPALPTTSAAGGITTT